MPKATRRGSADWRVDAVSLAPWWSVRHRSSSLAGRTAALGDLKNAGEMNPPQSPHLRHAHPPTAHLPFHDPRGVHDSSDAAPLHCRFQIWVLKLSRRPFPWQVLGKDLGMAKGFLSAPVRSARAGAFPRARFCRHEPDLRARPDVRARNL